MVTDMKMLMVVPWFPSTEGNYPESQQGIFEYRQTMKLISRGNEFKVITIRWRGQLKHEFVDDKVEVYRITPLFIFPKIRYPLPNFIDLNYKIRKVYESWNPDLIIYSHIIYLTALPIFWFKNRMDIPSLVTTDVFPGIAWFYGNRVVDSIGYLYSIFIGKRIFRLADGVQLMSSGLNKYSRKFNLDSNKTFTITRGVDTELFKPRNDRTNLRTKLGISENEIVILYVGRLDLVKGVHYLLQAAERILTDYNNIKFVIAGEGSLRQKYESSAKYFPQNIIFTGWSTNIPDLMNIADIFVLPSLSEGAANAAMEASASALPVIATEVGEIPEIISNGETGVLVKPKDVDGLVNAIVRLLNDLPLAKKMGKIGRERMETKYSWDIICNRLESAYQDLIERRKTKIV